MPRTSRSGDRRRSAQHAEARSPRHGGRRCERTEGADRLLLLAGLAHGDAATAQSTAAPTAQERMSEALEASVRRIPARAGQRHRATPPGPLRSAPTCWRSAPPSPPAAPPPPRPPPLRTRSSSAPPRGHGPGTRPQRTAPAPAPVAGPGGRGGPGRTRRWCSARRHRRRLPPAAPAPRRPGGPRRRSPPRRRWPQRPRSAGAGRPSTRADAFLELRRRPLPRGRSLSRDAPGSWSRSPAVTDVLGPWPSEADIQGFKPQVLSKVEQDYRQSGLDVDLTTNPGCAAHT